MCNKFEKWLEFQNFQGFFEKNPIIPNYMKYENRLHFFLRFFQRNLYLQSMKLVCSFLEVLSKILNLHKT
jgi:hypothetical protein